MRRGAFIIIGIAAFSLSACKFGTDRKANVEKKLVELFEQITEIKATMVACPGDDKKIADGDMVCTATTSEGVTVALDVTLKGDNVSVKIKDPLLIVSKFKADVASKLPEGAGDVTCPKTHMVAAQGAVLECTTDKLDVRVEFKDATGNYRVTWAEKGAGGAPAALPTGDAPFAKPGDEGAGDEGAGGEELGDEGAGGEDVGDEELAE